MDTETTPKKHSKKIVIVILIIVAVYMLFVPYRYTKYADGGTEEWRAVTYTVVKWQNSILHTHSPHGVTKLYFFPYSFYHISDLADME